MIFDRSFDEGNNVDRVIIIAISCIVFVFPCLLMFSSILSSSSSSMAVSSTKYAEGDDKEERMRKRRRWIQAAVSLWSLLTSSRVGDGTEMMK